MFTTLFNRRPRCLNLAHVTQSTIAFSTNQLRGYYDTLEVNRYATPKEIKDSFLKLSKVYHPDNKITGSHSKFVKLKEAYDALKDGPPAATDFGDEFRDDTSRPKADTREPPRRRPQEPISMNHVHYVYKTLNREEQPRYRPFENHTYEDSNFNRFEYARRWDSDSRAWVYTKRSTARQYQNEMRRKSRILNACVSVIMLGLAFNLINYRFFTNNLSSKSVKRSDDIDRNRAGIYIIRDDK